MPFRDLHRLFLDGTGVRVDVDLRQAAQDPRRARASAAPAPSARSLPLATSRESGAMPQLVQGKMRAASAGLLASAMVAATSSAVSTVFEATSMAPTSSSLSGSSSMSEMGTREFAHSSDTCRIEEPLIAGKMASY